MLNWFTFGAMFITIILLIITCIYQKFKKDSEYYTLENIIDLQKTVIDALESEKNDLKKRTKRKEEV